MNRWRPTGTNSHYGPPTVGSLIAQEHAVWRVAQVLDAPLSDADREVWLAAGMPDLGGWRGRPYRVGVDWVAGRRPTWAPEGREVPLAFTTVAATRFGRYEWSAYPPSGRWPACSCCGEPMPCQAELQDREVAAGLATVELLAAVKPGCCWACAKLITAREKAVGYRGDNLDLPGGPAVRFHTRRSCWPRATAYELRWIAVDPRRERILTWPNCGGILVVHADGSSECRSAPGPLGTDHEGEPDCRGHLSHDHNAYAACYVGDAWFEARAPETCLRGCSPQSHPGTRTTRRPDRRAPA